MSVILHFKEDTIYKAVCSDPPTPITFDTCEFTYPTGVTVTPPTNTILYANGFVGRIESASTGGGNTVITVSYDPEVYELPTSTEDYDIRYFGSQSLALSRGFTMTSNFNMGRYGENEKIYHYKPSFELKTTTQRFRRDVVDYLFYMTENGTFLRDDCHNNYPYMVMLKTDELAEVNDKSKYSLSFDVGTNKRFRI